jgi:dihydroxynaphthoic acid synthetase
VATYEDISYESAGGVARLTIDRPQVLNAFTGNTLAELTDAYGRIGADNSVSVVVLTGSGERSFSAGGDVNAEAGGWLDERGGEIDMKGLYEAMRNSLKPTIARINGYAIGGGHHLAYLCDFSIAADHAVFGQNGPRVASPAQGWLVSYLVRVVGAKRAREIWMLCRRYDAAQALEWGLVNAVVPMAELDAEVDRWCEEMLALSPTSLKVLKRTFDDEYLALRELQDDRDYIQEVNPGFWQSGEQGEGANAFLEKRRPDFDQWR